MLQSKNSSAQVNLEYLSRLELIADKQEYQEQRIDAHLKWICENEPHSHLKNFNMVDCQSEIDFFVSRQHELEQQKNQMIHQQLMELKQELQKIDSLQPEESGISLVGPDYVIQDRIKKYRDEEMHKHETICNEEIQLIAGRFNSLKQQCEDRINQARLNYQNCWRIWQEETD